MLNINKITIENQQGIEIILDTSGYCPSTFNLPCKYKQCQDCYGNCVECWTLAIASINDFNIEWCKNESD